MASVTEEIKRKRTEPAEEPNQSRRDKLTQSRVLTAEPVQTSSQEEMTQEEWDIGTRSVNHIGSADLTGKLCQRVMTLIWWKVGADTAVMEHVVQVLEEWLRR
jgi:hypothetical protein